MTADNPELCNDRLRWGGVRAKCHLIAGHADRGDPIHSNGHVHWDKHGLCGRVTKAGAR